MNTQKRPSDDLCLESPDKSTIYLNIPKNASSFTSDWLKENGWISRRWNSTDPKYVALVLRDPVDRWCSGIAQYLQGISVDITTLNTATDKILFDVVNGFDDHTWSQHLFYEDIFPNRPRIAFHTEKNLQHSLKQYFRLDQPATTNHNQSTNNGNQQLVNYFKDRLQDPVLLEKIKRAYCRDYELMSGMDFVHYPPIGR